MQPEIVPSPEPIAENRKTQQNHFSVYLLNEIISKLMRGTFPSAGHLLLRERGQQVEQRQNEEGALFKARFTSNKKESIFLLFALFAQNTSHGGTLARRFKERERKRRALLQV